jgi:hypothetical protein
MGPEIQLTWRVIAIVGGIVLALTLAMGVSADPPDSWYATTIAPEIGTDDNPRSRVSDYNFVAETTDADKIVLVASPSSITANGLTTATLTATATYGGVLQDGVPVVFSSTSGLFSNWEPTITVTTTQGTAVTWLRSVPSSGTLTSTIRADASGTFTEEQVAFTGNPCQADLTAWTEYDDNPIFGEGVYNGPKAYYPAVLYSPTAFDGHGDESHYKMWFGTSSSKTGYAISDDGLDWVTITVPVTNINGYHAHVLYDANQFNGHGDAAYYKMWYWDAANSINYATSNNGMDWVNYPNNPVITNTLGWKSAPVYDAYVIYNNDGNPAYYEAWIDNNGKFYYITSTNGIDWTGDNRELLTDRESWEAVTYSRASVLKQDGDYHMWYGGASEGGGNHGIGYAVSTDGRHWIKSQDNPIFHRSDGESWRDNRTYTPRVLYSAARFDGHGTPEQYKMWFTGKDEAEGNYTIGYATLNPVSLSPADTSGSGQSGPINNPLSQPFVVGLRDGCGAPASGITVTFAISDTPTGANGQSLTTLSGTTNANGQISSTLTLGNKLGVYTVTADATNVHGMPAIFTATASLDGVTLIASPASITANGLTTTTLTATVKSGGAAVNSVPIVFTSTLGLFSNWEPTITVTTTQGVAVTWLRSAPSSATVASTVRADAYGAFTETQVAFTGNSCQANLEAWVEYGSNPVFDPPGTTIAWSNATGLYDREQFSGHGATAPYKIWFSNGGGSILLITSTNGIDWTSYNDATAASGLTSPDHPAVEYYAAGFTGANSGDNPSSATMYYRIWYWRQGPIYQIDAIRYAESPDGVAWYNDQVITQDAAQTLVDNTGNDWNRGTYGPVDVFYNAGGSLNHADLWANPFVMYYEGTVSSQ